MLICLFTLFGIIYLIFSNSTPWNFNHWLDWGTMSAMLIHHNLCSLQLRKVSVADWSCIVKSKLTHIQETQSWLISPNVFFLERNSLVFVLICYKFNKSLAVHKKEKEKGGKRFGKLVAYKWRKSFICVCHASNRCLAALCFENWIMISVLSLVFCLQEIKYLGHQFIPPCICGTIEMDSSSHCRSPFVASRGKTAKPSLIV